MAKTWKELSDRKARQQREKAAAVQTMTPEEVAEGDRMLRDLVNSPDSDKIKSDRHKAHRLTE